MHKKLIVAGASLVLALAAFTAAHAGETGYITGSSINCRKEGWATSKVVKVLNRGDRAVIVDRIASWANLDLGEETCWVLSKYVGSGTLTSTAATRAWESASTSSSRTKAKPKARSSPRALAPASATHRSTKRSSPASDGYSAAGCPCSGSRVCVGPRGGRYCITSGGNKRYGV